MAIETRTEPQPLLRMVLDFGPILLFFVANAVAPVPAHEKVYVATGVFMAATVAAMLFSRLRFGSISPMLWVSGLMVVVFGALTLWLHDDTFIKVKPTIYYVTVAAVLFVGLWRGRSPLKTMFATTYPGLSDRGWYLASRNWAWFFVAMAVANEVAWRHLTTAEWIGYKLWGVFPLTALFALANVPMMMRHGLAETPVEAVEESPPQG